MGSKPDLSKVGNGRRLEHHRNWAIWLGLYPWLACNKGLPRVGVESTARRLINQEGIFHIGFSTVMGVSIRRVRLKNLRLI